MGKFFFLLFSPLDLRYSVDFLDTEIYLYIYFFFLLFAIIIQKSTVTSKIQVESLNPVLMSLWSLTHTNSHG